MSSFPKFLRETERKQTVSHGLTIISDKAFTFFLNVSKERSITILWHLLFMVPHARQYVKKRLRKIQLQKSDTIFLIISN